MGGIMGLMLRGSTWYYRRVIPPELRPFFGGKREVWTSLRTQNKSEAKLKAMRVAFEVERRIQEARKRLGITPTPDALSREWKLRELAEDAALREMSPPSSDDATDEEREVLDSFIADYKEDLSLGDVSRVRKLLDEVLKEQGVVIRPEDRQAYSLSLLRSRLEVLQVAMKRASGEPVPVQLTVRELVEAWVKDRAPHPKTASDWLMNAKRFERTCGASVVITQVTKAHVRAFKAALMATGSRNGGTLSARTVKKAMTGMASVFKWGVGQGYLDSSPFDGLTSVAKDRSAVDTKYRPFSTSELKAI